MTVSSNNKKNTYAGDGATVVFPYTFRILDESHVAVSVKDADGTITTKTITTDYTVSGVGDSGGGNITMVTAPASGETLILLRDMPFQQNTDYIENDAFPAESHEEALDELTMNDQQLLEAQERTIKLDPAVSGVSTTLPTPTADSILGWSSGATAIENKSLASIGSLSINGTTANGVMTYVSGTSIDVETNLKFDGTDLELVTGSIKIPDAQGVNDSNDNEQLVFQETASAVNHYEMTNASTGTSPLLKAVGTDTDVDFRLATQGAGTFKFEAGGATPADISNTGLRLGSANARVTTILDEDNMSSNSATALATQQSIKAYVDASSPAMDWELISSATASASATVEFTGLSSTYAAYKIIIENLTPATDATSLYLRTSTDNGSTFDSGASDYEYTYSSRYNAAGTLTGNAVTSFILVARENDVGNGATEDLCAEITLYNPSRARYTFVSGTSTCRPEFSGILHTVFGGYRVSSADVDAIQFLMSSGNITKGEFKLYGLRAA